MPQSEDNTILTPRAEFIAPEAEDPSMEPAERSPTDGILARIEQELTIFALAPVLLTNEIARHPPFPAPQIPNNVDI